MDNLFLELFSISDIFRLKKAGFFSILLPAASNNPSNMGPKFTFISLNLAINVKRAENVKKVVSLSKSNIIANDPKASKIGKPYRAVSPTFSPTEMLKSTVF